MGKKVVTVECRGGRGGRKFFQTGRDFSGAGGAVESGRSDGMLSPGLTFLPPRKCPRFPQAPRFAGGPSETGLDPSERKRFPSDRRVGGEVVWQRGGLTLKDFDGVKPEAAKRELTARRGRRASQVYVFR